MKLDIEAAELEPLVAKVVAEVLHQLGDNGDGRRLAYSEQEAAGSLGVARHVVRDARRRNEIEATKVGRSYRRSRQALLRFLGEGHPNSRR